MIPVLLVLCSKFRVRFLRSMVPTAARALRWLCYTGAHETDDTQAFRWTMRDCRRRRLGGASDRESSGSFYSRCSIPFQSTRPRGGGGIPVS